MEARITEMGIEASLKKAPAAYTKRSLCWLNASPTRVADLSFLWRLKQNRTQPAERREKNDLERPNSG
jgi:hypothetical protein